MLSRRFFILVLLGLFISACKTTNDITPITLTDKPTELSSSSTPFPTKKLNPTETASPTFTVVIPTPMDTVTPKPVLKLCSPLAEQSIQEIPEIISDPYNPPHSESDARHHGTDFSYYRRKERTTIAGEGIQALTGGQVVAVVQDELPYGNMVIIETQRTALPPEINTQLDISEGDSLYILYAHLGSAPIVVIGNQINCGEIIGEVGATGYNIVNPHLHLETRIGPARTFFSEGMVYYDTGATEIERANYELWRTSGEFRHFDPMFLIHAYLQNEAAK